MVSLESLAKMEARKQLDGLSFKEMRFKVCRFLEEQGVVNDLRARLRYKFVEALTITTRSAKRSSRTLLHQVSAAAGEREGLFPWPATTNALV
ncbi:hypothetical protein HPB51_007743 [Rhipicephalus microplus]|uniref:Uncharacterized protein n=1 Tax=Rhipicephalus microplus TaxID=6941 RepID=A0A9J6DTV7_RHIMP|nr:hypothetical protein HPB51_007743 [Rhipicephalus microplus]